MSSYLRVIAVALGLAIGLGLVLAAFGGGARYQLVGIGTQRFALELAETPELRRRGLRGRAGMEEDGGMLVRLDQPEILTYSTRHTPFGIDILYLGQEADVVRIDRLAPNDERLTASSSGEPVWGAVLLPAGTVAKLRIGPGIHLDLGRPPRRSQRDAFGD